MIDITVYVVGCLVAITILALGGIFYEHQNQKIIATLNGVLEREILRELRSRGIRAKFVEGNLEAETDGSGNAAIGHSLIQSIHDTTLPLTYTVSGPSAVDFEGAETRFPKIDIVRSIDTSEPSKVHEEPNRAWEETLC